MEHGSTVEGQPAAVLCALLLVSLSLLLSLLLRHRRLHRQKLLLPPSPSPSLPVLGHVLQARKMVDFAFVQGLRDKLGPIFNLHVGNLPMVFISSAALAHEALVEKSLLFAGRPQLPGSALFNCNLGSISATTYGPHWRRVRRNLVQEMLAIPKILSFAPARLRIVDGLISRILTEAQSNGSTVSFFPILKTAMFQLLTFMCFGFHMPEDVLLYLCGFLDELMSSAAGSFFALYPSLGAFNVRRRRALHAMRAKQVCILSSHIEKHKELHKLGQVMPGSYVETLLHMEDKGTPLSTGDLVSLCSEFLVGGTDSTVTTLEWTMACLVTDPSIQSKLHAQICDVVGHRHVEEEDLLHIPYLQAILRETLRLHPPGHFLVPHAVSGPCRVGGYDIPPNAIVNFHVASIARDPEIWKEPLKYMPERFMEADVDITESKELTMMPFGAGRRICPGIGLASMHIQLFVARLVQAFEWTTPPSGEAVDLTECLAFTVRMKHPLRAGVRERSKMKAGA